MAYKHGIYGQEVATSLVPMTQTDAGLVVAFGTAPVHLAADPVAANTPVLCYTYAEAVKALGYSDDFEKYTLCEVMKSQFALFNMTPVVLVNVLDTNKHIKDNTVHTYELVDGVATIKEPVLLDTLAVFKDTEKAEQAVKDKDYTAGYSDEGNLLITVLSSGTMQENTAVTVLQYLWRLPPLRQASCR